MKNLKDLLDYIRGKIASKKIKSGQFSLECIVEDVAGNWSNKNCIKNVQIVPILHHLKIECNEP